MIRPYVTLSAAMSLDGYLDSTGPGRLLLSNGADFDRVDEVRAQQDAILVGRHTIARDDPRLLVRSAARRQHRTAEGLPGSPRKITLTASGDLDPGAAFFTTGPAERLVYCPTSVASRLRARLAEAAIVIGLGTAVSMPALLGDLHARGVRRLLVEGGSNVHTQFLTADLVDELQLVVAPFFVGDHRAPRFVGDGSFPFAAPRRARLVETRPVGDVVLLRYALSDDCPVSLSSRDASVADPRPFALRSPPL